MCQLNKLSTVSALVNETNLINETNRSISKGMFVLLFDVFN